MRIILCANEGGCAPGTALVFKPSMLPIKKKHHVITMFAGKESCADHYVCKRGEGGRCAPRNPPAALKASMLPIKKKHHVITMFAGKEACVDHYICKWGPNPPAVSKPSMSAITKKHHAITRFVAREGCAAYVVRRPIFSEYILKQVLTVSREWILKIAPIESAMVW